MKLFAVVLLAAVAAAEKLPLRSGYGAPAPVPVVRSSSYAAPAPAEVRVAPVNSYSPPQVRTSPLKPVARILEESNENNGEAGFAFRFVSDDGIERQESGDANAVTGQYSYTSPEGVTIVVRYVADALGFRAESDSLPTPVPTEYPTPDVPSTEAAPEVRTVQGGYRAPAQIRTVQQYTAPAPEPVQVRQVDLSYGPTYQ